ncbi:Unknown protein sequence [Pseudomonas coronafaciens pv. oryzae]|nr:Unknown protein sequence [Pseudomonas coronafaciens pv. oryzae]
MIFRNCRSRLVRDLPGTGSKTSAFNTSERTEFRAIFAAIAGVVTS